MRAAQRWTICMNASADDRRRMLPSARLSLILAAVAAIAMLVLAYYAPLLPVLLFAAAALGAMSFAIRITGFYVGRELGWVSAGVTAPTFIFISHELMPRGSVTTSERVLLGAEFLAIWLLVWSLLSLVFRPSVGGTFNEGGA